MSGKDNVGTSGGVTIDKIDSSGYGDCSSFDTLNVAIRWPRTPPALPQAGHAGAALHSSVMCFWACYSVWPIAAVRYANA